MKAFEYERPVGVTEAVALARRAGSRFLGGGTNLVDLMKLGVETPDLLVDLTGLDLAEVLEQPDGALRIGATVRNSDLSANDAVRARYPVLSQALVAGASGQLRNMATVGGNMLQRTRCPYFQDVTKACNKRVPGSGCPARAGEHRNLAILGASEACIATSPSDFAVALAALDAGVTALTTEGEVSLTVSDFFRLPGDEPQRDTNLPPGALVTALTVPRLDWATRSAYRKVRDRASYAFALVSVAAAVDLDGDRVRDVRLALGGVAHAPWRATRAEEALRGGPATEEAFSAALRGELEAAEPLPHNGFKVDLAHNVAVRTLTELTGVPA
ncbi:MAG: xanthine dehydrogenase YagS FAD-binding subunit [Actinomycetota bacterium]|jgi:xanthine dehydrogenase YagS FAD-binding subunit|nr:xanthine dehydrogenase YagS FAD-binding subunit [Actinomycetota bacterium]